MSVFCQNHKSKVLDCFLDYPDRGLFGLELARLLRMSSASVHGALTELYHQSILKREAKGKTIIYTLNEQAAIVRSLKIIRTIELLTSLVRKLSLYAEEMYLMGSSARGEYGSQSDIDLAVIVKTDLDGEKVEEIVSRHETPRRIQLIVFRSLEWESLEMKDPIFYAQVTQGINIFNRQTDEFKFQEMS